MEKNSCGVSSDTVRQREQATGTRERPQCQRANSGTACAARQSTGPPSGHFVRRGGEIVNSQIGRDTIRGGVGLGAGRRDPLRRAIFQYGDIAGGPPSGSSIGPFVIPSWISRRKRRERILSLKDKPVSLKEICTVPGLYFDDNGVWLQTRDSHRTESRCSQAYCRWNGVIIDDGLRQSGRDLGDYRGIAGIYQI